MLKSVEVGVLSSILVLDEMLALRLGVTGSEGFVEAVLPWGLKVGAALLGYEVLVASVDLTGVVDAIVPPTPVRNVGLVTLTAVFLVIEQLVGGTLAVGATRAGL
jgi:hypothetical protein